MPPPPPPMRNDKMQDKASQPSTPRLTQLRSVAPAQAHATPLFARQRRSFQPLQPSAHPNLIRPSTDGQSTPHSQASHTFNFLPPPPSTASSRAVGRQSHMTSATYEAPSQPSPYNHRPPVFKSSEPAPRAFATTLRRDESRSGIYFLLLLGVDPLD